MKPITTKEMELALVRLVNGRRNIILPNASWGVLTHHEADLLVIETSTQRMGVTEIEIKVSVSDFRRDARKNHSHTHALITRLVYAMPESVYDKVKDEIRPGANIGVITAKRLDNGRVICKWIRTGVHTTKEWQTRAVDMKTMTQVAKLLSLRLWDSKHKLVVSNDTNKHLSALLRQCQEECK